LFDEDELFLTKKIKALEILLIYGFLGQKFLDFSEKKYIFLGFELT
jgi:hypothetical protein